MGESGCRRLCKICIVLTRRGRTGAGFILSAEPFLSKIPHHLCLFIHVINVANRHLKQPNLHLCSSSTLKNLYTHQTTHIIKIQIWHGVKLHFPVVFVGTIFNTSENNNYYLNFLQQFFLFYFFHFKRVRNLEENKVIPHPEFYK